MAANSDNKADLSVDNVHTPFGLTKQPPATSPHSGNDRNKDIYCKFPKTCRAQSPYP